MTRVILWLYIVVSVANVVSKAIPSEVLEQLTKPLLMPFLMFYVYRSSIGNTTLKVLLLSAALLFSWLGDVALIYKSGESHFILGIGLFLIAQCIYVYVLRKSSYQKSQFNFIKVLPFVMYAGLLFYLLLPADDFTLPILIYGLVITLMAIMARLREGNTSRESYSLALTGAILFLLSDSFLAYDSFKSSIPYSGVLVMSTYCAAQLLLTLGILKHVD